MPKRERHRQKVTGRAERPGAARNQDVLAVAGLIVAGELPNAPIDLGDCVISPLPDPKWTPPRETGLVVNPEPGATSVMVLEPEVRFRAQHAISTYVPANTEDAQARRIAQARFDRVVNLLGLAQGPLNPPPLVQIVAVTPVPRGTKVGEPIDIQPNPTVRVNFHGFVINPMSDVSESRFVELDRLERSEPHVATLVRLWGIAEQANRTRFKEADNDSCLVNYCRVIEQVVITMNPKMPELSAEQLEPVVSKLALGLQDSRKTLSQRARGIERATRTLQELRFQGNRRRLIKSLGTLDAARDLREGALLVWDLRSSRAGHPSPVSITEAQVVAARWTACLLLMRFFDWRWGYLRSDR